MKSNPFYFGGPAGGSGKHFFGRKELVQRIMNRIRLMQDSSIIGERRIGKTSLLYFLQDEEVLRAYGIDPEKYLHVYFSFSGSNLLTPTLFWKQLLHSLRRQINNPELLEEINRLIALDEIDSLQIEDLFIEISTEGLGVIFFLDEFENVTLAENLDADFFSHLRSLAVHHYISLNFVTSSRQKLSELSHAGIVGSPFFNIFETFFLKPFQKQTVLSAVQTLLQDSDIHFEDNELNYLYYLTGGHPFFLQMAASYLFDAYHQEAFSGEGLRLERVENKFFSQADPHFEHYWNISSSREKILLLAFACLRQTQTQLEGIEKEHLKSAFHGADVAIQVLLDRGLVIRDGNDYRLFSPAFERWLLREVTKSGSAGASYSRWLDANRQNYQGDLERLKKLSMDMYSIHPFYWGLMTTWLLRTNNPEEMFNSIIKAAQIAEDKPIWLYFS